MQSGGIEAQTLNYVFSCFKADGSVINIGIGRFQSDLDLYIACV